MSRAEAPRLRVCVVYLRPDFVFQKGVELTSPATIGDAIDACGVRAAVGELGEGDLAVGVFGERRSLTEPLHDGDRVEIYRPLAIDPKEARRVRVAVRRRRRAQAPR